MKHTHRQWMIYERCLLIMPKNQLSFKAFKKDTTCHGLFFCNQHMIKVALYSKVLLFYAIDSSLYNSSLRIYWINPVELSTIQNISEYANLLCYWISKFFYPNTTNLCINDDTGYHQCTPNNALRLINSFVLINNLNMDTRVKV